MMLDGLAEKPHRRPCSSPTGRGRPCATGKAVLAFIDRASFPRSVTALPRVVPVHFHALVTAPSVTPWTPVPLLPHPFFRQSNVPLKANGPARSASPCPLQVVHPGDISLFRPALGDANIQPLWAIHTADGRAIQPVSSLAPVRLAVPRPVAVRCRASCVGGVTGRLAADRSGGARRG